jgi:hypothetical protein
LLCPPCNGSIHTFVLSSKTFCACLDFFTFAIATKNPKAMAVVITGYDLTIEQLVRVARYGEKVELHPDAIERIKKCRAMLEKKIQAKEIMYGVNTGIGEFSEIVLSDEQIRQFQRYLIYNHSAGIGDAMPIEWVRGAMLSRINVHAHGHSGIRPEITLTLVEMLNKGVTPYVCKKGSKKVQKRPDFPLLKRISSSRRKSALSTAKKICNGLRSFK